MSTRSNVIVKDSNSKQLFYRHSDGYPSCTGVDLAAFVQGYLDGSMRDNVGQSAGWLILRGHFEDKGALKMSPTPDKEDHFSGWKVGAYEPADEIAGDIEYLYIIDLDKKQLTVKVPKAGFWDKPTLANTQVLATMTFENAPVSMKGI